MGDLLGHIKHLLDYGGIGINGRVFDKEKGSYSTFLSKAVEYRDRSALKWLLENGADPNQTIEEGWTVLMSAAQGPLDILEILLRAGADPNRRDRYGHTAYSCAKGHSENLDLIVDCSHQPLSALALLRGHPDELHPSGVTNLMFVASSGFLGILRSYLPLIQKINAQDSTGKTALHHALDQSFSIFYVINRAISTCDEFSGPGGPTIVNRRIIKILLESGADPTLEDHEGISPYQYAIREGNQEIVDDMTPIYETRMTEKYNPLDGTEVPRLKEHFELSL